MERREPVPATMRGQRLRDLAELEGITLAQVATRLAMSPSQLSKIVNGRHPLSPRVADRAMDAFDLQPSFFTVMPMPQDLVSVTFRKRSTSSALADKRVAGLFTEASRLWREASRGSGYRTSDLPDPVDHDGNIEDTALALRHLDGLDDDAPVPNVTRLAERHGIAVICGLDPDMPVGDDHSGVSRPSRAEDRPLIATVADQPGAVARLTLAHELGHLVFDKDLATRPRSRSLEERRAFAFAAALLLPEPMMRQRVSETLTLHAYLRIKADYGASVGAIVRRAESLAIISTARARSLHIQLSSQGWRANEPVPVPDEQPMLLPQALRRVWPTNTVGAAAHATGAPQRLVAAWAGLDDGTAGASLPADHANVVSLASRRRLRSTTTRSG